jgi:DNA-binding transcriptional MocR family regulator
MSEGFRPLREAIATYLYSSRAVRCTPEQVIVVSGSQQALDLIARAFLAPGDEVVAITPSYDDVSMLASFVTVPGAFVHRHPGNMSPAAAGAAAVAATHDAARPAAGAHRTTREDAR